MSSPAVIPVLSVDLVMEESHEDFLLADNRASVAFTAAEVSTAVAAEAFTVAVVAAKSG